MRFLVIAKSDFHNLTRSVKLKRRHGWCFCWCKWWCKCWCFYWRKYWFLSAQYAKFLKGSFSTDQGIDEMLFAARAPRGYCGLRKR
jgi:hypothetical protein